MAAPRARVASSFTIIKGALIQETYSVLAAWDFARTSRQNLARLREENFIGAATGAWLRDVAKVLHRRLDPAGRDRPLATLAKQGCDLDVWRPLLLWHITRDEFLLRDFLLYGLYPWFEEGVYRIRPSDVRAWLRTIRKRGGTIEHAWTQTTQDRVAVSLLKLAVDFGLLQGRTTKRFRPFHLPDESFLYLLHALREETPSPRKILDSPDWRLYLMSPADVERELLRLHQFRKVEYHVAGSLVQLSLPCAGTLELAERRMK